MKKFVSLLFLLLFLSVVLVSFPQIEEVKAQDAIYIRSDGSVEGTDKIERNGDLYYLIDNIEVLTTTAGILVQKDNIIIDGGNFNIQK
jgi:hypothetical protein